MNRSVRLLALYLIVAFTSVLAGSFTKRPYELVVVGHDRGHSGDSQMDRCSVRSFRQTQIYRGLSDGPGKFIQEDSRLATDTLTMNGEDATRLARIFSYKEEVAWSRARSLCGDILDFDHTNILDPPLVPPLVVPDTSQKAFSSLNSISPPFDASADSEDPPQLEIQPLIVNGPSHNRVDLVFFSDGYTVEEHSKFIDDAMRLAEDVSGNQTFNTVKPLLNFWAAFTPSNESGIGVGGKPKDTTFGLYRDGTELRGVYYSKPEVARAACSSMGDRCNYPILLGNDPLYGGLGGEFTVITSSLANGPLVLRHELGHSIIDVGEEYDGGYAYFGVNAVEDLSEPIPWTQWLNDSLNTDPPRIERSIMPLQEYPWTLLNTSQPWSTSFASSGAYNRHLIRFSLSGIPSKHDFKVEVDGFDLGWTPRQDIGVDRWHYDFYSDVGFTQGIHEVKFTLLTEDLEGKAQLCSVESLEYGDENEFIATPGYYGLFPTFSEENHTSYRPTNEDCLMRSVVLPNFCKVCREGLWLSLLRRIELIDDVQALCEWHSPTGDIRDGTGTEAPTLGGWKRVIDLRLIPLAQFRDEAVGVTESYEITWKKDGIVLVDFTNKTRLEVDDEDGVGVFDIDVKFATEEVRVDEEGLLTSGGEYTVPRRCGT